ncbi:hypothetical protein [Nonomuraea sediminis]|uniref:hypothetical protein n=1 Tax=Nonomuraea sediminis TaxID=2835864 RepID=UPI001BDC6D19|nr:hypothetical protein [Nonomuraea sediminis]
MSEPSNEPGSANGRPGRAPFIVGSTDPSVLATVASELDRDPEVTVQRKLGSAERPSLLTVEMTPAHADELKAKFGPQVTIEPDSPVQLY